MATFVSYGVEFVVRECGGCGVLFAMTAEYDQQRVKDRKGWYCPNGCCRVYTGKSEAERLREELERKQRALDAERGRAIALEQQRDQIAKAHRKMRDRVRNGVCPCCDRTFQNLMAHMRTEHPDFGTATLKILRDAYGLTQSAVANEIGVTSVYVSLHERGKHVPEYARQRIDSWIEQNSEATP
ncbi:MAG: helix-turn-helix domain-containing protein [Sinimarinibacterium flocculans]|uniref:helix-turn-helix domain-containing protein n=1 Tax=Sinimarinibacterium flocculans TaxID=985250 RepID=UPI003C43957C